DWVDQQPDAVRLDDRVGRRVSLALIDHQAVLEPRTATALHEDTEAGIRLVFLDEQLVDFRGCRWCDVDHAVPLLRDTRIDDYTGALARLSTEAGTSSDSRLAGMN